ncbi:aspartate aminotransferase family protein [Pontibacillus sp. HMF3514]|uniref:aspartate aminotransferase family protein n=1 Tax=Pontibacillus sp. HMF3514 TaxID=2692425 RepID=UPI00131FC2B3|nr:aspartate aminotransferase family protein [Pontibacillus sp. HMF3514]QHE52374.1 acetylornithine/succinylornithine family transaminase [Pontibacillus sp. HMF3514]
MPHNQNIADHTVMTTYNRLPVTLLSGKGSYVWDENADYFLDYTSGIATCNLGHVPERVKEKVEEQVNKLWHCSNLYHIPTQEHLATKLTELSCTDQVFFCNSGAEANEAAIKLARRYSHKCKEQDPSEIVTFSQSFHGRTLATLTATGQEKIQDGFAPLPGGFRYLPYNDFEALNEINQEHTIAVMLELIQGEGGVIPANPEWIQQLAKICHDKGILLMVDEVQTGIGRTGTLFAYEQFGIEPDVITLAKGLGSGFPVGAVLAKENVAKAFVPGSHASTFGGNPLATTAALATLETIQVQEVLKQCNVNSFYLKQQLEDLKAQFPEIIFDIRGEGFLLGMETRHQAIDIVNKAREHNVLILTAGQHVVRILPPLTTDKNEIDLFINVMRNIFNTLE